MVSLNDITGQHNAIRFLKNSLASERTSGSFLFLGPRGVGRALTAEAFVKVLIGAETLDHPDVTWIKPLKNRKIKIEEIRKVKNVLSLKPYGASVSVCVIEAAHMMTIEASNALLKILEEPPSRSVIILISDKRELLLPTVVSRCSEVRFNFLSVKDTKNIVSGQSDVDEATASFLAYFSQGSPGVALGMVDEGLLERKERIVEMLGSVADEEDPSCLIWDEEKKDNLLEDLELVIMILRDVVFEKQGLKSMMLDKGLVGSNVIRLFERYKPGGIFKIVERLIGFKRALEGNVNPKLVAQALPGALNI